MKVDRLGQRFALQAGHHRRGEGGQRKGLGVDEALAIVLRKFLQRLEALVGEKETSLLPLAQLHSRLALYTHPHHNEKRARQESAHGMCLFALINSNLLRINHHVSTARPHQPGLRTSLTT